MIQDLAQLVDVMIQDLAQPSRFIPNANVTLPYSFNVTLPYSFDVTLPYSL